MQATATNIGVVPVDPTTGDDNGQRAGHPRPRELEKAARAIFIALGLGFAAEAAAAAERARARCHRSRCPSKFLPIA